MRDAEPEDGLERRVLRAIETRSPGRTRTRTNGSWRLFGRLQHWHAVVAVAVLVLALVLGAGSWRHRGQPADRRIVPGAAKQVTLPGEPSGTAPSAIAAAPSVPEVAKTTAPYLRAHAARSERTTEVASVVALANHPAPEQPLTDEERLLLRLSHRAGPEEFDVLNPDARDAQARSDKAEFQKFFGPPPTGDSE